MRSTVGSSNDACGAELSGKKIILGVTGSIAAYKAAYLASALVRKGADVHVVMTSHARSLICKSTFWALTSNPVLCELFEEPERFEMAHVSIPESADLMLIAPATANILAKLAYGIADDMLSTMALVVRCPMVIAPAMNSKMWTNPVVQANVDTLRQRGIAFIEPEEGRLACGTEGPGRLAEPEQILEAVDRILAGSRDLAGLSVVVSAGPTREPIDPVRFISNRSSGKMGYAIAEEAASRGAKVTLVSGPTDLTPPIGVGIVRVETVREMLSAVKSAIESADIYISAAAPADFTPASPESHKIKKSAHLTLELDQAPDILAEVGKTKGKKVLVGFAAETDDMKRAAADKLKTKHLDLIVANDVSAGSDVFGSDENQVTLMSCSGDRIDCPRMSKREVARAIMDYISENLLEDKR